VKKRHCDDLSKEGKRRGEGGEGECDLLVVYYSWRADDPGRDAPESSKKKRGEAAAAA